MFEPHLNERPSRVDWPIILAVIGLALLSVAFICSAKSPGDTTSWQNQFYARQIVWFLAGTVAAVGVCFIDYHSLSRWAMLGYWLTILLLVGVLIPGIGSTHGWGARRWIDLGPFQFQPAEFAKLSFIFLLAHFLSRPPEELKQPSVFLKALGFTALPFLLILKEPDLGSALVLLPVGLIMAFIAGVPRRFLTRLLGGVGMVVVVLLVDILFLPAKWQPVKLEGYQRDRLLVYFGRDFAAGKTDPEEIRTARIRQRDVEWNVRQALISVGSGGFWGKGWRQGQQIALGYLPPVVAHNDFIFSVIAEEKGFLGSVMVLYLYTVVLFSGIRIAYQARDRLGKLLAAGVVALLFTHVFVNIGMNIRLVPVTGIPLPLLSYGGSSVVCSLIALGILQNVYIHRKDY